VHRGTLLLEFLSWRLDLFKFKKQQVALQFIFYCTEAKTLVHFQMNNLTRAHEEYLPIDSLSTFRVASSLTASQLKPLIQIHSLAWSKVQLIFDRILIYFQNLPSLPYSRDADLSFISIFTIAKKLTHWP